MLVSNSVVAKNKPIKKLKRKYFWRSVVYKKLVLQKTSYLHTTGWITSLIKGYPCRVDGHEIPWMNYSIVSFLEKNLLKDFRLFEFGSGYSTIFYSRLVGNVDSVEYDKNWYEKILSSAPDNVSLMFLPNDIDGEYCRAINKSNKKYDVVIIDGRDRVNCIIQSIGSLSSSGVIILDDSERDRYQEVFNYVKNEGFRVLDFEGLKPGKYKFSKSSLIYRDRNCLGI